MKGSSWESCGFPSRLLGSGWGLWGLNEGQLLGELRADGEVGEPGEQLLVASMKGSSWESCGAFLPSLAPLLERPQ